MVKKEEKGIIEGDEERDDTRREEGRSGVKRKGRQKGKNGYRGEKKKGRNREAVKDRS